ncbi:MAG: hypothetical protein J6J43_08060 [Oscillospiraceae bacterium]|nr:hypothetical protein [Oscillospiraceae bacterium]
MAFLHQFEFAPAPWLPIRDQAAIDKVGLMNFTEHQGTCFENPEFELKIVFDVHNYFAIDLYQRIKMSHEEDKKLVVILPSPENAVFLSVVSNLNKFNISCRNVHIFFLYEYANEHGDVAPWESPYSRSGHFMRYFYQKLRPELRMPMDQIHFWTKENADNYSDLIDAEGGADICYTALSWSGGIGAIDAETFKADSMEELLSMGSRVVTPMPEFIAHESLRGMFGCSGDIGNVPPCAATIGPRDIAKAKYRVDVEYLSACGGSPSHQKYPAKMALYGPICPENPASILRTMRGICYMSEKVAAPGAYKLDNLWLADVLEAIRKKEEG